MAGNTTSNTTSLIRQQVYSDTVLEPIKGPLLSDSFVHDLSDFKDGDTINVPVLGEVTVHDRSEEEAPNFSAVSNSRFTMTITNHKEAASAISQEQMEDGYATKYLQNSIIPMQRRAIMEVYQTSLLAVQSSQTAADPNNINGTPHRFVASGTSNAISLQDFANAQYAMNKAGLPNEGRIAIIDSYSALVLSTITNITNLSSNPGFTGIINQGLASNDQLYRDIYGFRVVVSDLLATVASETVSGTAVTNAKACMFMCVADNQTKPIARAWRRAPMAVTKWNEDRMREEYRITARWGTGLIRPDGLVVCLAKNPTSGFTL